MLFHLVGCAALKKYGKLEKSARQQYRKGNYDAAVFDCAASLRQNPKYDKAQALIQDAFRAAVNTHESKIKQLELTSAKFKWDDVMVEYQALIKLNEAIRNLPTLTDKKTKEIIRIDVIDYTRELAEAQTKAAEAHYQEGLRLSRMEGVDFQKHAAKEFKIANRISPGYKDAATLYEKSRQAGIKRIAIIPFADKSGKRRKYGAISERIMDEIISQVMDDPSVTEFLEIISRDHLEQVMQEQKLGLSGIVDERTAVQLGKVLGVHEILTGQITQIIYTPVRKVHKTEKDKSRVVIKKEKYKDAEGKEKERNVWGDVHATVRIYTKTTKASISGSYKVLDVQTAKIKYSKSFVGKADFKSEWATYAGDKRALSKKNKSLVKRGEQLAPVEEEMVSRAMLNLSTSLVNSLKEYAR